MAGRLTLAEQALDCFGVTNQTKKAAEECLELAASLLKLEDIAAEDTDENVKKVIGEIADVKNCIEQLESIFGHQAIAKIKAQKETRLFDKICRVRSERNGTGDRAVSTGQAPWIKRDYWDVKGGQGQI